MITLKISKVTRSGKVVSVRFENYETEEIAKHHIRNLNGRNRGGIVAGLWMNAHDSLTDDTAGEDWRNVYEIIK